MTQMDQPKFAKPPPMSDVGMAVLIGLFIASFTMIYIMVDDWYKVMAVVPLVVALAMFGYLFGGLGIVSRIPKQEEL